MNRPPLTGNRSNIIRPVPYSSENHDGTTQNGIQTIPSLFVPHPPQGNAETQRFQEVRVRPQLPRQLTFIYRETPTPESLQRNFSPETPNESSNRCGACCLVM